MALVKAWLGWFFVSKGQEDSTQGFNPISANLVRGPFDGRMAFVPEGQADSSQARSAWVAMQRAQSPGGTAEVVVSPLVSPRDTCRRNGVPALSKRQRACPEQATARRMGRTGRMLMPL